jgi:hypothetical protein
MNVRAVRITRVSEAFSCNRATRGRKVSSDTDTRSHIANSVVRHSESTRALRCDLLAFLNMMFEVVIDLNVVSGVARVVSEFQVGRATVP